MQFSTQNADCVFFYLSYTTDVYIDYGVNNLKKNSLPALALTMGGRTHTDQVNQSSRLTLRL